MGGWCFGLVREKGKIKVYEIYWGEKKKPLGTCDLDWWQYFKDFFMIISDITSQLRNHNIIDIKEFR